MASFLDIGLFQEIDVIFAFLLVWILGYVVLGMAGSFFDMKQNIRALTATVIAFITLATPVVLNIVILMVPWFSLMFVFLTFLLLALMALGVKKDAIEGWVKGDGVGGTSKIWVVIIAAIILLSAVSSQFFTGSDEVVDTDGVSQAVSSTGTTISSSGEISSSGDVGETGTGAFFATLFHPKVLGIIFVMLIALFAVAQLAK